MSKKRKKEIPTPAPQPSLHHYWVWGSLALILILAVILRLHLLPVPLERDEGEYAYAGQLILQGIPPYVHAYNMKMPGIYGAYAVILSVFGQTPTGLHLGLLFINLATICLIFFLGKKMVSPLAGLASAAGFAVLSVSNSVQGIFTHAEHLVILFSLGGLLLLINNADGRNKILLFLSGILFGAAVLMKQHGIFFILFSLCYLAYEEWGKNRFSAKRPFALSCLIFSMGVIAPLGMTLLFFLSMGMLHKFWFWTYTYASEYTSLLTFSWSNLAEKISLIFQSSPLLWVLAGFGCLALLFDKQERPQAFFIGSFLAFSFLATTPGFYFRPHYFILLLPAVSLLIGVAVNSIAHMFPSKNLALKISVPAMILIIALAHSIYNQKLSLFQASPVDVSRLIYGIDPFPESIKVSEYIKKHTSEKDRIAVIGSEPQIYFYSHRHSATGYIYMYALMEDHPYARLMEEEMISEIESARPLYLIFVNIPSSWFTTAARPRRSVFTWFEDYQQKSYERVGIVDMISPSRIQYLWDEDARRYDPKSRYWIAVFRRK